MARSSRMSVQKRMREQKKAERAAQKREERKTAPRDEERANSIREGKTFQLPSVIQTGRKDGMQSMDSHLLDYLKRKIISPEEAYAHASNKSAFRSYLPDDSAVRTTAEN